MNKVILSLLLAVCILGMALIMLNERLGRKSEPAPAPAAEVSQPTTPDNGADLPPLPADGGRNGFAAPPEAARAIREFTVKKTAIPTTSSNTVMGRRVSVTGPLA